MKKTNHKIELKIIKLYKEDKPTKEIINRFSIANTTLYRILERNDVLKKVIQGLRVKKKCLNCRKVWDGIPYEMKIHKFCSKKCADDYKRGKPLVEFFGPEKARNVTEIARKRAKNNPNLKKFKKGNRPWNKGWDKGSYFSKKATENIRKGQLKVAAKRKGKTPEEWYGQEGAKKWRKMQSKAKTKLWQTHKYQKIQMKSRNLKPNKLETNFFEVIQPKLPKLKYIGNMRKFIGGKNPDFIIEDTNKLIEIFGDYYHGKHKNISDKKEHEKKRIQHFKKHRYDCLVIWESDWQKNKKECINRVIAFAYL